MYKRYVVHNTTSKYWDGEKIRDFDEATNRIVPGWFVYDKGTGKVVEDSLFVGSGARAKATEIANAMNEKEETNDET